MFVILKGKAAYESNDIICKLSKLWTSNEGHWRAEGNSTWMISRFKNVMKQVEKIFMGRYDSG